MPRKEGRVGVLSKSYVVCISFRKLTEISYTQWILQNHNLMIFRRWLCCILWPLSCMLYLVKQILILLALLIFFFGNRRLRAYVQRRRENQLRSPLLEPCPLGHGGAEGYSKRSVFGQTGTLVFGRENVRNCQFSIFRHHFIGMCPQMPPIPIR